MYAKDNMKRFSFLHSYMFFLSYILAFKIFLCKKFLRIFIAKAAGCRKLVIYFSRLQLIYYKADLSTPYISRYILKLVFYETEHSVLYAVLTKKINCMKVPCSKFIICLIYCCCGTTLIKVFLVFLLLSLNRYFVLAILLLNLNS